MSRYQHVVHTRPLDIRRMLKEPDLEREQIKAEMDHLARQITLAEAAGMPLVYAVTRAEAPVVKIGFTRRLTGRGNRFVRMPGCRLLVVMPRKQARRVRSTPQARRSPRHYGPAGARCIRALRDLPRGCGLDERSKRQHRPRPDVDGVRRIGQRA